MGHWRDGGIGNMAGSDDRLAEEFTLLERLAVIAGNSKTDEQFNVADVADDAFEEIERLREANDGSLLSLVIEWRDAREAFFVGVVTNASDDKRAAIWDRLAEAEQALMAYARSIKPAEPANPSQQQSCEPAVNPESAL